MAGNPTNGDWQTLRLGDLGRIVTGKTPSTKTPEYFGGDIPFVTPRDMDGRKTIASTERYLSEKGATAVKNAVIPAGAVMVSCIGSDLGKAAIAGHRSVTNQQLNSIIVDDSFYAEYVYYNLSTRQDELKHRGAGGSAVPILNKGHFSEVTIDVPPLSEQRAIAEILGGLDAKIELNRRMNETLESLARALFKSWFVDFDPVRAKLDSGTGVPPVKGPLQNQGRDAPATPPGLPPATAALFPDSFEHHNGQLVPTGWRQSSVGDHVELQRGKTYKSKLKGTPGPYLLGLGSIERNGGFRSNKLVTYGGDNPENLLVYPGDLYVSLKDVTQAADLLGAVARVPTAIKVGRMTQDTVKLVFKEGALSRNIVYGTLLTPEYRAYCRSHATGTTNLGLSRDDFLSYPLIVPSSGIEEAFDEFMACVEGRVDTNSRESETLAALRDTLLPRLLSGELRVADAARTAAEVR